MERQALHPSRLFSTPDTSVNMKACIYSVLVLWVVGRAVAGEPTTNAWGPLTNNAQMTISVVAPGSHFVGAFPVDGGTNFHPVPPVVEGEKSELKVGQPFSL